MPTIFVSHSSKEKDVTDQLAILFSAGLGIHPDDIFCTSLDGQGVRPGSIDTEEIKRAILECQVALLLVSPGFRDSCYCNYELGALWMTDKPIYVLLVPPWKVQSVKNEKRLNWLLANRQMTDICNEKDWDNVHDWLIRDLDLRAVSTATWQAKKTGFVRWAKKRYPYLMPPPASAAGFVPTVPDPSAIPDLSFERRSMLPPRRV